MAWENAQPQLFSTLSVHLLRGGVCVYVAEKGGVGDRRHKFVLIH